MQRVLFKTTDNVQIAANYFPIDKTKYEKPLGWIIFLHMRPATKESWTEFALEIQNIGYNSLAIDFRGHGESQGGPDGFKNFSDTENQKRIYDVEAAADYLKTNGAELERIILIGASIGANLALKYISEHSEFKTAVLFSPGLDYRGIKAETAIKNLKSGQKIFLISSKDDGVNSVEVENLIKNIPKDVKKEIQIFGSGGHGTEILKSHPELKELIIKFIKDFV